MTVGDLAYAAGIIDGEGCIVGKRGTSRFRGQYTYNVSILVGMTDFEAVDWLFTTFGGYIYTYQYSNRRPIRRWGKDGAACQEFLKLVLPYLKVKRDQAQAAIDFPFRGRCGRRGRTQEFIDQQAVVYQQLRDLKTSTKGRKQMPAPRIAFEEDGPQLPIVNATQGLPFLSGGGSGGGSAPSNSAPEGLGSADED